MQISSVTYLVRDYDEAIDWFVDSLGFVVLEDVTLAPTKRWVRVAAAEHGVGLLLAKAEGPAQQAHIGHAAGGRVAYFLQTENFAACHQRFVAAGVNFREAPRAEPYGTVAVFEDLYGNGWDLIEPNNQ